MKSKLPPQFNQPNLDQDRFDQAWQAKSPQEKEAILKATVELALSRRASKKAQTPPTP